MNEAEAELCKLIASFYESNPSGGPLHICTDDGNLEDGHIWYCVGDIQQARDVEALFIAYALLLTPLDARYRLYEDRWWGMHG
jgi:hypothetical protein